MDKTFAACAGLQTSKTLHCSSNAIPIGKAVATAQSWDLPVQVIGLWVNSEWQVEVVSPIEGE